MTKQKQTKNDAVSKSEKVTLIVASALMAIGLLVGHAIFYLSPLLLVMIVLDVLVIVGNITSETPKRLIIFFSILGGVVALYLVRIYYSLTINGWTF